MPGGALVGPCSGRLPRGSPKNGETGSEIGCSTGTRATAGVSWRLEPFKSAIDAMLVEDTTTTGSTKEDPSRINHGIPHHEAGLRIRTAASGAAARFRVESADTPGGPVVDDRGSEGEALDAASRLMRSVSACDEPLAKRTQPAQSSASKVNIS